MDFLCVFRRKLVRVSAPGVGERERVIQVTQLTPTRSPPTILVSAVLSSTRGDQQAPPTELTYSFQDLGQHPGGRGRFKAAPLRRNNLRATTRRPAPAVPGLNPEPGTVPPALPSQGCSTVRPLGAAREWQALRFRLPALLTMVAARAGPAPPGQRPSNPRWELRADLVAPRAPTSLAECGPLVAGWGGASRVRGGACTSAAAVGACVELLLKPRTAQGNCFVLFFFFFLEWSLQAVLHLRNSSQSPQRNKPNPPGITGRRCLCTGRAS